MQLVDIRERNAAAYLYKLLDERDPVANISHRQMPTFDQHCAFVKRYGEPYAFWGLIEYDAVPVGAIYLTTRNEIGIAIAKTHQGAGYGPQAVRLLMQMFGEREYLANIAPGNVRSREMFAKLGFELCQVTMRRRGAGDEDGQD